MVGSLPTNTVVLSRQRGRRFSRRWDAAQLVETGGSWYVLSASGCSKRQAARRVERLVAAHEDARGGERDC